MVQLGGENQAMAKRLELDRLLDPTLDPTLDPRTLGLRHARAEPEIEVPDPGSISPPAVVGGLSHLVCHLLRPGRATPLGLKERAADATDIRSGPAPKKVTRRSSRGSLRRSEARRNGGDSDQEGWWPAVGLRYSRRVTMRMALGAAAGGGIWLVGSPRVPSALAASPSDAPAASSTVDYGGLDGLRRVRYSSHFLGSAAAIHRNLTNYGWGFGPAAEDQPLAVPDAAQLLLARLGAGPLDDLLAYDPSSGVVQWFTRQSGGTPATAGSQQLASGGQLLAGSFVTSGRTDLALFDPTSGKLSIFHGQAAGGFAAGPVRALGLRGGAAVAGDFDGDGLADVCVYGAHGDLTVFFNAGAARFDRAVRSIWPGADGSGQLVAADFDQNHLCDLGLYAGHAVPSGFEFRFNRGDGTFGPRTAEMGTPAQTHLWATFALPAAPGPAVAGVVAAQSPPGIGVYNRSNGRLTVLPPQAPPAYNYSVCLMRDGGMYRLWYGARWRTLNTSGVPLPGWDGDHICSATSSDGHEWLRRIGAPEMYQGKELGKTGWWTNNYLQPQVVKVDGVYYMFWQVEIQKGQTEDTGQTALYAGDRIGLSTSTDARTWTRMISRGVVINLPDPAATKLGDEEVLYVANDVDGRPWWLYLFYFTGGHPRGFVRLRSADPTTFDWNLAEHVTGLSQLGNGCAYADRQGKPRVYLRITFATAPDKRTYPTLQVSADGLTWGFAPRSAATSPLQPILAGSTNDLYNRNVYFLGLSTIDGTGRLEPRGGNRFHAFYAAATSNTPTAPAIFHAQIGLGELMMDLGG